MFASNMQAGFKKQVLARFYLLTNRPVCSRLWSTYLSNKISPSGLCLRLFHLPRCFQTFYSCSKKSYQLQLMSANYIRDRNLSLSCTIFAKSQPPSKADASKTASKSKSMCQVFDSSEKLIGVMTFNAAEELAKKENLRLVSMGENQDGLASFTLMSGHDLAQESMKQRKSEKTEKVKEKEFRLTSNISDHDLEIKIKHMKEVISHGDHIKLAIKGQKKLDGVS